MISCGGLSVHYKHKCKDVLVTYQESCKLAENIIEKEMKNHKQLIRIFFSLILFTHSSSYRAIQILVKYFIRKKRLVNPTDSTYPKSPLKSILKGLAKLSYVKTVTFRNIETFKSKQNLFKVSSEIVISKNSYYYRKPID